MKNYNLAFIGFGNVGRALARLLAVKANELRDNFGSEWRITGVASRSLGWLLPSESPATLAATTSPRTAARAAG